MPAIEPSVILTIILTLVGLWAIVTVPVYISAKIVTGGRARFTQAMGATVLGPLAYGGVLLATIFALGSFADISLTFIAILLALAAWFWVFKTSFKTGWLAAIGITVLAVVVFIGAGFVIGIALIMFIPHLPPQAVPVPLHPI